MLIEIYGAGFHNKGAELMLRVVADELRRRLPGVELCLEAGIDRPFPRKAELGLYSIWSLYPAGKYGPKFKPAWVVSEAMARAMPARFLRGYGIVKRTAVDAFLDISGLSYGDKMGVGPVRRGAFLARWYQNRGKPAILLPQMFGPFEKPDIAAAANVLLESAERVFVRDTVSLEVVEGLVGRQEKITLAPDLTLFTKAPGEKPPAPDPVAYIVPNHQVYTKGHFLRGEDYIASLGHVEKQLRKAGYTPRFLLHDGSGKDQAVIEQVLQGRPFADHVTEEADPIRLKATIGRSSLLVASRFHAVAGALSQGVPSLTIGWGHKYEELHRDFGVPELCLSTREQVDAIGESIARVRTNRADLQKTLIEHREKMRPAHLAMWEEVLLLLQSRSALKGI